MSSSFKSTSRDVSPTNKISKLSIDFKSKGVTTTKIPSKQQIGQNIFNNKVSTSFKMNKSEKSTILKSNERERSLSGHSNRDKSGSKSFNKNDLDTGKSYNMSKDLSNNSFKREKSKDITNVKSLSPNSHSKYGYVNSSSYGRIDNNSNNKKIINNIYPIKPVNSLLNKYEQRLNEKSTNSPNKLNLSNSKLKFDKVEHTRNLSKEILKDKELTPKSNHSTSGNSSNLSGNKSKSPDRLNKSPNSRSNKFNQTSTIQKKMNFRDTNTSPLLIHKKFKNEKPISTNINTTSVNNVIKQKSITNKQGLLSKHYENVNESIDIKNELKIDIKPEIKKSTYCNKYINKVYEISRIGYQGPGVKKFNQDNYFIFENFLNNPDSIYLSVCDGHGTNGHDVSKFLRENLPNEVNKNWLYCQEQKKSPLTREEYHKVIEDSFKRTNNMVINNLESDTNFSGSTCVSLIYNIDHLICANVGDSRCTLGRKISDKGKNYFIILRLGSS